MSGAAKYHIYRTFNRLDPDGLPGRYVGYHRAPKVNRGVFPYVVFLAGVATTAAGVLGPLTARGSAAELEPKLERVTEVCSLQQVPGELIWSDVEGRYVESTLMTTLPQVVQPSAESQC